MIWGKALVKRARGGAVLACSFCGKTHESVKKLIAGPTVFICDECIQVCVEILANEPRAPVEGEDDGPRHAGAAELPELAPLSMSCALCHITASPEDLLFVHDRGGLCPGCVAAIEAALGTGDAHSGAEDA